MKHRTTLAMMAALLLLVGACAGDDGGGGEGQTGGDGQFSGTDITFSISLAEEERQVIEDLLSTFEEDTGATVQLASVTSSDLPQKLQVEVGAGNPTIHLFAQDNLALRVLVDEELVQSVEDVEIPTEVIEAMIPDQFDGQTYFLPFRPNVKVAYANQARLESVGAEPPKTTDELREVGQAMAEEAGTGKVVISLAEGDPAAVTMSALIVAFGGEPLVLNDEGSVAAFEYVKGLWDDGILARESLQAKFDTQVDYLRGETAWMGQNWPFTSSTFAQEGVLENFTVYEGWAGPERAAHVIGGDVLGIPQGVEGDQRDAAAALAEFLMSREAQEQLAAENAWPSIREDAYAEVPEEQQETFDAIQAALEDGWFRPNVAYWSEVTEAINTGIRRIIVDGQDAKAVLDELHGEIEAAAQRAGATYPPEEEAA